MRYSNYVTVKGKELLKTSLRSVNKLLSVVRREAPIDSAGISDRDLIELIGKTDPVILDIGCNDGSHTLLFLKLFERAKIYSFEPDPRARQRYEAIVKDDRAHLFDVAISDVDGVAEFHLSSGLPSPDLAEKFPQGWDLSGSLKKPKHHTLFHPWCKFEDIIEVKTMKLDTWTKQNTMNMIDFIWADVQGAEADLIRGAAETLKHTRYFYTEYNNWQLYEGQANLKKLMQMLPGFEVVHRYENDVLFRNTSFCESSL